MKVVIASTTEAAGGAARAAQRLHRGLLGNGIDSTMLVAKKQSDDESVIAPATGFRLATSLALRAESLALRKLFSNNPSAFIGINRFAFGANKRMLEANPDIVHLHWVGAGLLSVEAIARIPRPVIWTLHDMWAFTGGCYYDAGCGRYKDDCGKCPQLNSSHDSDITRWTWRRKQRKWRPDKFIIVTPSRWLAERAKESSLLSACRIQVIPNGLDLTRFKPLNKEFARQSLGLPVSKRLILFGARSSTDDPRKGFEYLHRALLDLSGSGKLKETEAIVFGGPPPRAPPDSGLPVHHLGELHDETSLALVYNAADIFVAPSVQENLPNTVMESMACGTPCIAFRIGGMPDLIDHAVNGHLADPFNIHDLAAGIEALLTNAQMRFQYSAACRKKVETEYELDLIACRHVALYNSVLEGEIPL